VMIETRMVSLCVNASRAIAAIAANG